MPVMHIPAHEPVTREWMGSRINQALVGTGVRQGFFRNDQFRHKKAPFGAQTRVPFLVWCLGGEIRFPKSSDESFPFEGSIQAGEVMLYAAGSMVNHHEPKAKTYLRVTMDTDLTLFIISTVRRGVPFEDPEGGFLMRACTVARPVPPAVLDRMTELAGVSTGELAPLRRRCLIELILADLLDLLQSPDAADWSKPWQTWMEIQAYVREHAHRPLSRKTVAQIFGIHPGHVSRLYIRYSKDSFNAVLNRLRLARAEALLKSSGLPIAEIAVQSGFTSASYFAWAFRKAYGCAPSRLLPTGTLKLEKE